jgi:1-acyl-sn-glycerol-3-phosphate acyltransferase
MTELHAIHADSSARRSVARTVCDYTALYSALLLFGAICLSWSLLTVPLYPLLPRQLARRWGRRGITAGFRFYTRWLELVGVYRLDLSAIDALRAEPALILAANHPSLIDAPLILSRHPNLSCVMKAELSANVMFGPGARLARYIRNGSPLQMVREAVAELRQGGVLLLFPEGTRTTRDPINALTKSIGVIARRAGAPVQTLLIETASPYLRKGGLLWSRPPMPIIYRIRLGRRFEAPQDVDAFMRELERYFRGELQGGPGTAWGGSSAEQ